MHYFLLHSLASLAIVAHGLPQQSASASIDPADPNQADPTAAPATDFALPSPRTPEPFAQGIPVALPINKTRLKPVGFWDAQDLLKYAARWSIERSSRDIVSADYWIGSDWRTYSSRIKANLGRASTFINDSDKKSSYITITCQDPKGYCNRGSVENKAIGGYAWDVDWTFWTYGHINMCDPYYTLTDITGKIDDLNGYRKNQETYKLQDMRYYQTYGQFLAHEMMHLRSTYDPEPKIVDAYLWGGTGQFKNDVRAYGPKRVHQLAQGDASGSEGQSGGAVSTVNADSYVMLINSIFWWDATQYFPGFPGKNGGSPPPGIGPPALVVFPSVSLGNSTDVSIDSINSQFDAIFDAYLVSDDADDAPAQDQIVCHGISGDYWVMSRNVAVQNVIDFCGQTEPIKDYNVGSVNALELSVRKLKGDGQTPQDAPSCVGRFQNAVIDGCDGADPINNPHNYKFGSTLTTADGWEYKMTPLSQQVNEVSCDVSYKFFYDSFEIRGKNLPDGLFGAEGEGLHSQMSGCGALTDWNFERTPDDCCFQWYASGHLTVGTKACVGRALESAGGSGDGNCHGAGKRHADNIDRWPGYGDDSKHVFRHNAPVKRDSITTWPGYGDEGRHVFKNSTRGGT
ncbi:hypothetical protein LTR50_007357 [Elasticomyces elasticus]|nr:hypothetical protein LTR50_007357 [Elasticomyces elasticus]